LKVFSRGLPGSKFLSLLRQRKEPKKDVPAMPAYGFP
jgi:hypothetical protein